MNTERLKSLTTDDEFIRLGRSKEDIEIGRVSKGDFEYSKISHWTSVVDITKTYTESIRSLFSYNVELFNKELKVGDIVDDASKTTGVVVETGWMTYLYLADIKKIIPNVSIGELIPLTDYLPGQNVYYKGWLGTVCRTLWDIQVKFEDGQVATIPLENGIREYIAVSPYNKYHVPYVGQKREFKRELLKDAVWEETNPYYVYFLNRNCNKIGTVIQSKLKSIEVDWKKKLLEDSTLTEKPPFSLNQNDLQGNTLFDFNFRNWSLNHSYCCYTVKPEDIFIPATKYQDYLYKEFFQGRSSKHFDPISIVNENDGQNVTPKVRRSNYGNLKCLSTTQNVYKAGSKVFVDVIRRCQTVDVLWEDNRFERLYSVNVTRSSGIGGRFREYVTKKGVDESIGIITERKFSEGKCKIKWLPVTEKTDEKFEAEEQYIYNIIKHPKYGLIYPGQIVKKSGKCTENFDVAKIKSISKEGLIQVVYQLSAYGEEHYSLKHCGIDLIFSVRNRQNKYPISGSFAIQSLSKTFEEDVKKMLKDTAVDETAYQKIIVDGALNATQSLKSTIKSSTSFAIALENDLKLLKGLNDPSVWVKAHEGKEALGIFSMVIIGSPDTPFEDGIFEFEICLTKNYPQSPPLVSLLTPFSECISPFIDKGQVSVPFTVNWSGAKEQWTPNNNILDVINSLKANIFVPEPFLASLKKDCLNGSCEHILCSEAVESLNTTLAHYNKIILIEILDSMHFHLLYWPTDIWKNLILQHLKNAIPRLTKKIKNWVGTTTDETISKTPNFKIDPINDGFKESLKERFTILDALFTTTTTTT